MKIIPTVICMSSPKNCVKLEMPESYVKCKGVQQGSNKPPVKSKVLEKPPHSTLENFSMSVMA